MQNGLCVLCDGAELERRGPAFTARAPKCPRCGHGLPFRGFTFEGVSVNLAEDGSTSTVQAIPFTKWGACRNHSDGVDARAADEVYDTMTVHGATI
jgi:hypothetical protein